MSAYDAVDSSHPKAILHAQSEDHPGGIWFVRRGRIWNVPVELLTARQIFFQLIGRDRMSSARRLGRVAKRVSLDGCSRRTAFSESYITGLHHMGDELPTQMVAAHQIVFVFNFPEICRQLGCRNYGGDNQSHDQNDKSQQLTLAFRARRRGAVPRNSDGR